MPKLLSQAATVSEVSSSDTGPHSVSPGTGVVPPRLTLILGWLDLQVPWHIGRLSLTPIIGQ